jgi:hypothetical protein
MLMLARRLLLCCTASPAAAAIRSARAYRSMVHFHGRT